MNTIKESAKEIGAGYAIGAANIIPGVSGGTFLLIFGLYEKVISILHGLGGSEGKRLLKDLFTFLKSPFDKGVRNNFFSILSDKGIFFLAKLGLGAGFALVSLAALMTYLLENHHCYTYALFFGLIAASVFVPYRLMKKASLLHLVPFIIGTLVTIFVAMRVDPVDKVLEKSRQYKEKHSIVEGAAQETTAAVEKATEATEQKRFAYKGTYSIGDYLYAGLAGAIAISAMVLPGLSGSLVLLVMQMYGKVLTAINGFRANQQLDHLIFLAVFSVGMGLGILVFVKVIDFVFKKYHDGTMAFLTGLILGSLFALWPFKAVTTVNDIYMEVGDEYQFFAEKTLYTNSNILPTNVNEAIFASLFVILGIIIMIPFLKKEKAEA